jgi:HEAT repeat protein
MIASAAEKLLALLEKVLEFRREVTLGIARDTLILDGKQLDPANPVYRDFAVNLFNARVASLTIQGGATAQEVRQFFEVLSYPRERIASAGGLQALLTATGVQGFRAQEVDYRVFHATEVEALSAPRMSVSNDESAVLWKAFVNGMVSGTIDPYGVLQLPQEQFDPTLLAEVLNREQEAGKERVTGSYDQAISDFLKQADRQQLNTQSRQELFDRLGKLIERLSPELRRRFLNSTLQGLAVNPDQATEALANWSQSTIADALEQVEADQLQVPRILMDILGKMGGKTKAAGVQRHVAVPPSQNNEQTTALLNKLFRDGGIESYVPDDYADALAVLAAADVETNLDSAQVDSLLESLNGHTLERQFCSILLDLLEQNIEAGTGEVIARNLEELINYFLGTGDFASLTGIHDHLSRLFDGPHSSSTAAVNRTLDIFASENFISVVLDGLDSWGKDQHPAIQEMIGKIGLPFVVPLLDCLADEEVMFRRRLYMECVKRIGAQAYGSIVKRLDDPHWYVVRNLVILLRELNDPEALRPLSRLFGHAHPKVQYEVIRTCLHLKDPRADRYLLRELERPDPSVQLGIVRLAANSRNPDVVRRLAELLNARGGSETDLALKSAIIATLAEMSCVEALPGLATFIESRSLFMAKPLLRLKLEAVASLGRYTSPEAAYLAARLQKNSSGDIAQAAAKVSSQLRGVPS